MARAHTDSAGLRIALFGDTGSGKSATGNTILGSPIFRVGFAPHAITQTCQHGSNVVNGRRITVIDNPGLFNTSMSEKKIQHSMQTCATLSFPGLHAFLLVIRLDVGLTEEEMNIVRWIQTNFGENAARYTIILFTHADQLNDTHLDDFIRESRALQTLINTCGDRYHAFNNLDTTNQNQVTMLIEKIDKMVQRNSGHHLTQRGFSTAQRKANELEQQLKLGAAIGIAALVVVGLFAVAKLDPTT